MMQTYPNNNNIDNLQRFAQHIRLLTLKQLQQRGFGHYGGSLSLIEVLAVLYGNWLKQQQIGQHNILLDDWFILSKGHGGPALYATLALKGWFDETLLYTLNDNGTRLPSHPDRKLTPGIHMTTGSLGQGIGVAVGIAKGIQLNQTAQSIYTVVGDGELNEGSCYESLSFAAHHGLDNLYVFVDENKKQLDGYTCDICNLLDLQSKFSAFGFFTQKVSGSDVEAINVAIQHAHTKKGMPKAIILDTAKGQGVPYLENKLDNHHLRPNEEDTRAITEAIAMLEQQLLERGGQLC